MIANKDYLLIKAIKQAKCCCNGKDGVDDQSQVTLKKFAELTIDDINYMMDYPEDLPVCDVMAVINPITERYTIIGDTLGDTSLGYIRFFFSTEEKALNAINYGSYGCGTEGIQAGISSYIVETITTTNGVVIYNVKENKG